MLWLTFLVLFNWTNHVWPLLTGHSIAVSTSAWLLDWHTTTISTSTSWLKIRKNQKIYFNLNHMLYLPVVLGIHQETVASLDVVESVVFVVPVVPLVPVVPVVPVELALVCWVSTEHEMGCRTNSWRCSSVGYLGIVAHELFPVYTWKI